MASASNLIAAYTPQMFLDAMEGVAYAVNKEGVIVGAGSFNWDAFAAENAAGELTAQSVLGRDLSDFINGADVKRSYELFRRTIVEQRESNISFTYRCDAPDVRRLMRLCISPIKSSGEVVAVLFQSLLVEEQDRPRISLFDPEKIAALSKIPDDALIITVCSYCHDVLLAGGRGVSAPRWVKPEEYYRAGGSSDGWISHGICPACHERLVAPLLGERAA